MKKISLLSLSILLLHSCVKDEYIFDEDTTVTGLSPTLAIPLAYTSIGLGELEAPLGLEDLIENEAGTQLAVIFKQRLFEIGLEDLIALPPQEVQQAYTADAITAAFFNASLEGDQIPINQVYNLPFDFQNGEEIDSIRLGESFLTIQMVSSFRHDLDVHLVIPELQDGGTAFTYDFSLEYTGSLPVSAEVLVDIGGLLLNFTSPGNNNELNINADFLLTHSGEPTFEGDSVYFDLNLSSNSIEAGYGYLGQYAGIAEIDTQRVDIFESIDAEFIYFADPAIELDFYNSSGIPIEIDFSSIYAPSNSMNQIITGGALQDIPVVAAAALPGLEALTEHRIDNSNTSPLLSDMLSEGPVDLIYTAEGVTNPEGFSYNFILDTSKVSCDATVILPLYASVNGYQFSDTLDVDLGTDLGLTGSGNLTIDDVVSAQLRIISDNGLPLELSMQLIFLDSLYEATDSLFLNQGSGVVLAAGMIDSSLPITDPNHGRVIAATHHVTDVELSQIRLREILDGEVRHILIRVLGNTSESSSGQLVRFYPEDRIDLQLSAKIETEIDISE